MEWMDRQREDTNEGGFCLVTAFRIVILQTVGVIKSEDVGLQ